MSQLDDSILVAYADGELDAASMRSVGEALEHDPSAREKVRQLQLSTTLIRAVFHEPAYQQVSPELAQAISNPQRTWWSRWKAKRFMVPIAASIFAVAIFAGGIMLGGVMPNRPPDFSERLLDEVAEYHVVYARDAEHQVEVPAQQVRHIETWLGGHLYRSLHVPDLSDHGLSFKGARLLVVEGQPVAQLLYVRPDQPQNPLALCISFAAPGESPLRFETRERLNLALWGRKGYTYVLVGWEGKAFLSTLASEVMSDLDKS